jgi:PilZ domain
VHDRGYNDRRSTVSCVVRDISDTGARLRVEGSVNAPDTFLLIIELDGLEADCEVVWRKPPDLAVAFVSPPRKVGARRAQVVSAIVPDTKPSLRRKPKPSTS